MLEPTVTWGTGFYNAEWSLEEYFNALLNQQYPLKKIELVFLDNGSRDNTFEELKRFKRRHGYKFRRVIVRTFKKRETPFSFDTVAMIDIYNAILCGGDKSHDLIICGSDCIPPPDGIKRLQKAQDMGGDISAGVTVVASPASQMINRKTKQIILGVPSITAYLYDKEMCQFMSIAEANEEDPRIVTIAKVNFDKVIRVHSIGTGFSRIAAHARKNPQVRHRFLVTLGVDFSLCTGAVMENYKIFCDTGLWYEHIHYKYEITRGKDYFKVLVLGLHKENMEKKAKLIKAKGGKIDDLRDIPKSVKDKIQEVKK